MITNLLMTILTLAIPTFAQAANSTAPLSSWQDFYGSYSFVSCKAKKNIPIWSEDMAEHFVEISNVNNEPNTINLYREKYEGNLIGLGASIERINQGRYREYEEGSKILRKEIHSYTIPKGVYGYEYWNYKDINIGWMSVELKRISENTIQLRQKLQWQEDKDARDETCILKKLTPRNKR